MNRGIKFVERTNRLVADEFSGITEAFEIFEDVEDASRFEVPVFTLEY
jgi:hypothetical protein